MNRVQIHRNGNNFVLDNKPFFYLADTIWSAFTNVTLEEWEYYLSVRKKQGFNVLQINILPQWDRCMSDIGIYPFQTSDGHSFDFTKWNENYFTRARTMCQMAVEQGFQLALVVLWLNYVPETWGSRMFDVKAMPKEIVAKYAAKVVQVFEEFHPIYVISGDTDFDTPEAVSYYRTVMQVICHMSPDSLKTLHVKRAYDVIPEEFLDKIDFYMFQSGHNSNGQHMAYVLPQNFRKKYPQKPIINAEPCYEQMGYSRQGYGRFEAKDIRRAAWSSILSGACAGVTYGAHGIWNWQKLNIPKNQVTGEGFDEAYVWQEALKFPGAWDYGMIRNILEEQGAEELMPANELLVNTAEEIRVAACNQCYFIYLPSNTRVVLKGNLLDYQVKAIDMEKKRIARLDISMEEENTSIGMHPFSKDALLIMRKG